MSARRNLADLRLSHVKKVSSIAAFDKMIYEMFLRGYSTIEQLHRLILDNALDSFIALDERGRIIEWSAQAEKTFGWIAQDVLGKLLTETIIPQRYHAAHNAGLKHYLNTGEHNILGKRIELIARRKDDTE